MPPTNPTTPHGPPPSAPAAKRPARPRPRKPPVIASIDLSLPAARTVRGYEIGRMPIGRFLRAARRIDGLPGRCFARLFPEAEDAVRALASLDREGLIGLCARALAVLPDEAVTVFAELAGWTKRPCATTPKRGAGRPHGDDRGVDGGQQPRKFYERRAGAVAAGARGADGRWLQRLIAMGLSLGIGKRELMEDYYFDEIGAVAEAWNAPAASARGGRGGGRGARGVFRRGR